MFPGIASPTKPSRDKDLIRRSEEYRDNGRVNQLYDRWRTPTAMLESTPHYSVCGGGSSAVTGF